LKRPHLLRRDRAARQTCQSRRSPLVPRVWTHPCVSPSAALHPRAHRSFRCCSPKPRHSTPRRAPRDCVCVVGISCAAQMTVGKALSSHAFTRGHCKAEANP
jgi:hypothetical protein